MTGADPAANGQASEARDWRYDLQRALVVCLLAFGIPDVILGHWQGWPGLGYAALYGPFVIYSHRRETNERHDGEVSA